MQHVLLVAGFNYEDTRDPFTSVCDNRITRLLNKSRRGTDLVFTRFDVGGGVVNQSRVDPKTKKRAWTELQTFTPVTTANYSSFVRGIENHFDRNPSGIMSITDVYAFVQTLGAGSDKGTVSELSFFSHGWAGGPILVNSHDATSPSGPRDGDDKDARLWKDFRAPTMDATALANFRAAFAASGIVWTWGCSFVRPGHIVLGRLFNTSKFRSTPRGKLKDTDKFTLDFTEDSPTPTRADIDSIANTILPGGRRVGRDYTVTATFADIKNSFRDLIRDSYCHQIATATGVTTFGSLPATYADEEKVPVRRLPLMVVPTRMPPYDDDLTANLTFYKTYLAVTLDPEGRGYGTFH
jgi:hypothetical protein